VYNVHSSPAISQSGWQWQREMLTIVAQQVASAKGPVLLLGDLNTTDQNENYWLIADHLTDVHRAIGWGFGFTFPGQQLERGLPPLPSPVLRIDHVFVSDQWIPLAIRVLPAGPGSDHLPVVAKLRLAD
jgi:endonuclease/exonuclease/phosphatase (EEP) superfamily protein YafD